MQTQQATTKTNPVELPIEQRIELARATLAKLQVAAEDAEAEAQRWAISFEREPTAQADAESRVTAQKAKNAHAAATTHEREVLDALIQEQKNGERTRLSNAAAADRAKVMRAFAEAAEKIAEASKALDVAIGQLAAHHAPRLQAQQAGAGTLGLSLEQLTGQLNDSFVALRAEHQGGQLTKNATARVVMAGQETRVVVELVRSAGHVPSPLL